MYFASFVKTFIFTLSKKKLIRINKLLSLSTETQMYFAYFVKILIVTLFKKKKKRIDKNK